ncbi:hypothetical protein ACFV4M_19745 [Kitasatospora indigofera]|uniref:hypothetical protein n=1 Tax=Kitasatospora indigofera TaxID=67307 RepID=UPI0036558F5B
MAELTLTAFLTLDGVVQAPGGPRVDPAGGFGFGGRLVPFADEDLNRCMTEVVDRAGAFLEYRLLMHPVVLGRGKRLFPAGARPRRSAWRTPAPPAAGSPSTPAGRPDARSSGASDRSGAGRRAARQGSHCHRPPG